MKEKQKQLEQEIEIKIFKPEKADYIFLTVWLCWLFVFIVNFGELLDWMLEIFFLVLLLLTLFWVINIERVIKTVKVIGKVKED